MARGKQFEFSQEKANKICELITEGKSLRTIEKIRGMPTAGCIIRWLGRHPAFEQQYAQARKASTDALFEEILDICDNGSNDWMEQNATGEGRKIWKVNGEHIQRSKLRVDTRKWALSKLQPKKYGEKVTTEHTGNVRLTDLSESELDRKIEQLERDIERSVKD